ncbi:hypothetical protein [Halocatena pleomorpha]|nr:hypothetical protein [Halocatena pleomorpha]
MKDTHDYLASMKEEWNEGTRAEYAMRPKDSEDGAGQIAGSAGLLCL